MNKNKLLPISQKLLTEIRENTFGPCTVIGECYSNDEVEEDMINFVNQNPNYKALTVGVFEEWLDIQLIVECHDRWPEDPFDRTDEQIEKRIKDRAQFETEMKMKFEELIKRNC